MAETTKSGISGVETIALGIATLAAGFVVSKLAGRVATAVVGSPESNEDEMYERIYDKIDNAPFRRGKTFGRQITPVKSETMGYVKSAIDNLGKAKSSTPCGVCQKKIDSAILAVEGESKIIVKSEAKYAIIDELKRIGKIPKSAKWNQLSLPQREFIDRKAEELLRNDQ